MKFFLSSALGLLLFTAPFSHAAEIVLVASNTPQEGSELILRVLLDTQGATINALEGALTYPTSLRLTDIRDGASLVNFWIESPHERGGSVRFAGIVPGGYHGEQSELLTLVFEVSTTSDVHFVLDNARALLHDGEGTAVPLTLRAHAVLVSDMPRDLVSGDTFAPEAFVPQIGSDASLFDGQSFVSFATQDKQSGIDRYRVTESKFWIPRTLYSYLSWNAAESPAVLRDQGLKSYVYVQAIDKAGNVRTEVVPPGSPPLLYRPFTLLAILMTLLGIIASVIYVRHTRYVR